MALRMLVLSLTGACNLACKYCYATGQDTATMNIEVAIRAINMARASLAADKTSPDSRLYIQLSGGEPLLVFSLVKAITAYLKDNKIPARLAIQTNGTLITDEVADFFARENIGIGVSLDGRGAVHDSQRIYPSGKGSISEVISGIQRLARRNIAIGLTSVVTASNVSELKGVIELAYFLGNVRRVGFDLLRGQGRGVSFKAADEKELSRGLVDAFRRLRELELLTGRRILVSEVEQAACLSTRQSGGFSHCYAMNGEGVHVEASGRIYACSSFVGEEGFLLGDVYTGIDAERQKEILKLMRRRLMSCECCTDFLACGGACYARQRGAFASDRSSECVLKRIAIAEARRRASYIA